jgi:enterochelin esterase-like enzyme
MDDLFPDLDALVVTDKILPYVEEHFRARAERRYRAAAGGSYGGAVAYHLAFKRWDLFSSAGIFGNGAAAGEEESIRAWLAAIPVEEKPRVFINVGESDTYMLERAKALLPLLDEAGIAHAEIFSPGGHSGDYWVGNFPAYFRWLASEWR